VALHQHTIAALANRRRSGQEAVEYVIETTPEIEQVIYSSSVLTRFAIAMSLYMSF